MADTIIKTKKTKDNKFEFIKGIAVSFVILLHTIESDTLNMVGHVFHIGQTVPLFLLVTFIVSFMSLEKRQGIEMRYWYNKKHILTMIKKVFVPFYIVQFIMWIIQVIKCGGIRPFGISGQGPGSYYPWVYLQFWILMPLLYLLLKKSKTAMGGVFYC